MCLDLMSEVCLDCMSLCVLTAACQVRANLHRLPRRTGRKRRRTARQRVAGRTGTGANARLTLCAVSRPLAPWPPTPPSTHLLLLPRTCSSRSSFPVLLRIFLHLSSYLLIVAYVYADRMVRGCCSQEPRAKSQEARACCSQEVSTSMLATSCSEAVGDSM